MSTATTVFGPSAAVNGTVTGLPGAVALEASTESNLVVVGRGKGQGRPGPWPATWPMLKPATPLTPLGRQSTQENTPGAVW